MLAPILKKGDTVRVIAPARSLDLPWMDDELKQEAKRRLGALGLTVTFGKYVNECDAFDSSSIEHRIEDLHDSFSDPAVTLILSVIGGYNSNQLLRYIDYDLIGKNPKRLCGFSDITALSNAMYAKTGLVTYSGPHFFNFGQKKGFEYTQESFEQCHFSTDPYEVESSERYIDGYWATNQDKPQFTANAGWRILQGGNAKGTIIGGNLCTLNLLQGTEFMPAPAEGVVLFIEDDGESHSKTFDRDLQSLLHQPISRQVRGIIIGRFERASKMTDDLLSTIIRSKRELQDVPVIANVDFGHTTPLITFPIGGKTVMEANDIKSSIRITDH